MQLNRLFEAVERVQSEASWRAVFGEPQVAEGKTLIPLAEVKYGFGLGFGQAGDEVEEAEAEAGGGGAGGGLTARPLGVLEVTPEGVRAVPLEDSTRLGLAGIALAGWLGFWTMQTVRKVLGPASE
jgi:uncharacterized spore protein YtfJ